jgi:hypothetical protein
MGLAPRQPSRGSNYARSAHSAKSQKLDFRRFSGSPFVQAEMTGRHGAVLAELAGLGLGLARDLQARALAAETPELDPAADARASGETAAVPPDWHAGPAADDGASAAFRPPRAARPDSS